MTISDCFRILELPRNACLDDLKVAYRSQAKKYHPDRKGGNSSKFNLLHEAYTFLLDYGISKSGQPYTNPAGRQRKEAEESRWREEFRKSTEERARREEKRRAAEEKAKKDAELKAAFERKRREAEKKAAERRSAYEKARGESELRIARERARKIAEEKNAQKKFAQSVSHQVFITGDVLNRDCGDKEKIGAINTLISLKRKSAYPFLKKALYSSSEQVVLSAVEAIGKLKIIQGGAELGSLMVSGSMDVKRAILDSVLMINKKNYYKDIIDIALRDRNSMIRDKAVAIYKGIYE